MSFRPGFILGSSCRGSKGCNFGLLCGGLQSEECAGCGRARLCPSGGDSDADGLGKENLDCTLRLPLSCNFSPPIGAARTPSMDSVSKEQPMSLSIEPFFDSRGPQPIVCLRMLARRLCLQRFSRVSAQNANPKLAVKRHALLRFSTLTSALTHWKAIYRINEPLSSPDLYQPRLLMLVCSILPLQPALRFRYLCTQLEPYPRPRITIPCTNATKDAKRAPCPRTRPAYHRERLGSLLTR